ncbi:hypothetical protein QYF61_000356 [Mycteria americana]|uniref:Uncharacterized protein n=1 Tax=Mycteria americana TaxID=33587 RepID=A0AAN7MJK8_MYCAM|nr:hypothetical protein QYF61_000356 [Mycteria americana]
MERGFFTRACSDRTRDNGFKLKEGRFRLDIRKKIITMRLVGDWNRFPREVVDAPSLEVFKVRLDGALSNLINACFTFMDNLCNSVHGQVHPSIIHLGHFHLSSLIHLLVVLMFFSGMTLGYLSIYVTYCYNQVLYPGSNALPQCCSPDGFASALPLEYSGPRILCIPDSKTLRVDLESPLSMNQLMDENQGVSVGTMLPPVRCCPSNWHLLFFDPQQPHNRRVLRETGQGGQLFNFLRLQGSYTKSPPGWRLNHFPGQSVPMLDNPLGEEKFPNIQSKPPLAQLEAISSCPITCYLGEETDPHLSTTSFQVVVESDEISPQPPFLQAKQSQLPQPLLIRLLLQTLHQLRCPSLYALQYLNIPLVVGGPKLNTVFEVWPHQCRVQGHNHFPSPADHAIFDTGQDAIGLLGRLGTLLAHIQAAVNQHPQVLLCQAAFQPLFPKPVALHGVAVAQVQDLALGLVKPHTIHPSPSIQPVQVPLQSLPTLQQINTPTQLGVVCKLTESALDPFVQIIDKDVKQNWPQHRALGNTACNRPPTGVNSINHHSLGPAVQPVLYPAKSTPVQAMSSQFLQENAVGNRVKGFTEV